MLPIAIEMALTIERTVSTNALVRPVREEIASAVIQGGAAMASVVGVAYVLTRTWPQQNALRLSAVLVYGVSMFIAFLASALYHGVQHERTKSVLQKIDHCTIFLFIAGTYTPVALLPLRHHAGIILLALIWAVAIIGTVLRLVKEPLYDRVAVPLYLAMGWLCLGWSIPVYQTIETAPILLIIAGGISYTGGTLVLSLAPTPVQQPHVAPLRGCR